MKILHTSDLHLSSPLSSRLSGEKARLRRRELSQTLSRLCEAARREGCQAMIIAGDLFDSERVTKIALSAVLDTIRAEKNISFYYLMGNHEGELILKGGVPLPENLFIFGEDWTSFSIGNAVISGRSRLCRGAFDTLNLDAARKNIVVLHGELRDTTDEGVIGIRDAKDKGIDYLALGHYHTYSETKIDDRCLAVYSGTPEGRGFDELGEMGYAVIDTDNDRITQRFVPFAKRNIWHIKVDIGSAMTQGELFSLTDSAVCRLDRTSLVRLELCGNYREGAWKSLEAIRARYEDTFFYFELCDSSKMAIDAEKLKYDKTLKGEFIRLVLSDDSISPEMRERIISCGLYSLLGEAIYEE